MGLPRAVSPHFSDHPQGHGTILSIDPMEVHSGDRSRALFMLVSSLRLVEEWHVFSRHPLRDAGLPAMTGSSPD